MKLKRHSLLLFLALFSAAWLPGRAADLEPMPMPGLDSGLPIDLKADKISQGENGAVRLEGKPARIVQGPYSLEADEVNFRPETGDFAARGHIRFQGPNSLDFQGEEAGGNFKQRRIKTEAYRAQLDKVYVHGEQAEYSLEPLPAHLELKSAGITTCSYEKPHYQVAASHVVYYPDDQYFKVYNAVVKVGPVPILYIPYLVADKDWFEDFGLKFGYSSQWGGILGIEKRFKLSEELSSKFYADIRSRGAAQVGDELVYETKTSETRVDVAGMWDEVSLRDINNVTIGGQRSPDGIYQGFKVDNYRYRGIAFHRQDLGEYAYGLSLRGRAEVLNDYMTLQDWYPEEYQANPQGLTYAELAWDRDRYILDVYARAKVNYFETVNEKLPELSLEMPRQRLFGTPFEYQSRTAADGMRMSWREFDWSERMNSPDYEAVRLDTLHMLYYPFEMAGNRIQMTPRVGARGTYYSATSSKAVDTANLNGLFDLDNPQNLSYLKGMGSNPFWNNQVYNFYDTEGSGEARVQGEFGWEAATKYYRTWHDYDGKFLGLQLDGLRHVVQPYANYTYISRPNVDTDHLLFFDQTDQLTRQDFVQLGTRQRWETRKENRIYTFARLDTYANLRVERDTMPDGRSSPGELGLAGSVKPSDVFGIFSKLVADMEDGRPNFFRLGTTLGNPDGRFGQLAIAYTFQEGGYNQPVYSMGSTLDGWGTESFPIPYNYLKTHMITLGHDIVLNPEYELMSGVGYDLVNDRFSTYYVGITRDLHCWKGSLIARGGYGGNFGIFLVLTLKAYPGVTFGSPVHTDNANDGNYH